MESGTRIRTSVSTFRAWRPAAGRSRNERAPRRRGAASVEEGDVPHCTRALLGVHQHAVPASAGRSSRGPDAGRRPSHRARGSRTSSYQSPFRRDPRQRPELLGPDAGRMLVVNEHPLASSTVGELEHMRLPVSAGKRLVVKDLPLADLERPPRQEEPLALPDVRDVPSCEPVLRSHALDHLADEVRLERDLGRLHGADDPPRTPAPLRRTSAVRQSRTGTCSSRHLRERGGAGSDRRGPSRRRSSRCRADRACGARSTRRVCPWRRPGARCSTATRRAGAAPSSS